MIPKFVRAFGKFFADFTNSPAQTVKEQVIDPLTIPLHERVRNVYAELDVAAFADYKKKFGMRDPITLVHATIDACITDIYEHTQTLEKSGYLLPVRVNYAPIQVPINRFFLTKEGHYLTSVRDAVQKLVDVTLELCKTIDDVNIVDPDTKSYNLRMLNSLLHVHLDLGETLIEISQEILASH